MSTYSLAITSVLAGLFLYGLWLMVTRGSW
jgi:hypothetical protein